MPPAAAPWSSTGTEKPGPAEPVSDIRTAPEGYVSLATRGQRRGRTGPDRSICSPGRHQPPGPALQGHQVGGEGEADEQHGEAALPPTGDRPGPAGRRGGHG